MGYSDEYGGYRIEPVVYRAGGTHAGDWIASGVRFRKKAPAGGRASELSFPMNLYYKTEDEAVGACFAAARARIDAGDIPQA